MLLSQKFDSLKIYCWDLLSHKSVMRRRIKFYTQPYYYSQINRIQILFFINLP